MKRNLLVLILLVLFSSTYSQTPTWEWVKPLNTGGHEISRDVVVDQASNSVYMVGEWANSLSSFFPTGTNPCEDFTAPFGQRDGYVAKFDEDGNFIWAFKLGGPGNDFIDEIVVDDSGNIYVTGYLGSGAGDAFFAGTSTIDGTSTISNLSGDDFYLAKYNSGGEFLWLKRSITNTDNIRGHDVAVNSTGVFVSGSYENTCTIGTLTISQTFGQEDMFVAKFDTDGNEEWIIVGGSDDTDFANSIVADENNIYVTGDFAGTQLELKRIDGVTISTIPNSFNGWEDGLIFSYDSDGTFRWAESISTSYRALIYDLAHDNDSIYITGAAEGDISFPSYAGNPITSSSKKDIYTASLAKSNGNTGWVHLLPCTDTGDEEGNSITLNPSGEVLVTGAFRDDLQFPESVTLTAISGEDVFVAKYSPNGSFIWAQQAGSTQADKGYGISAGSAGDIYVSGRYDGTGTFGLLPQLPDDGGNNAFIAKLSEPCTDAIGGVLSSPLTDICNGGSTNLILSTYNGTITWQSSPEGASTWTDIAGEILPDLIVSPFVNTDYRAYLRNGACNPDSSNILTIVVYDVPVSNPGTGNDEVCGDTYAFQALLSTPGIGKWTSTGPGTASYSLSDSDPNAVVTVTQYGSYDFTWTETNVTCIDDSTMTVVFYEPPTANAGSGGEACGFIFDLQATPSVGTGAWTYSGPGIAVFIDASSNPSTRVSVDIYGTYIFTWTETNGTCVDDSTVTVIFYEPPTINPGTGGDVCGLTFTFGAIPSVGTGSWSQTTGPGTSVFSPLNSNPDAEVTVSDYGSYTFTWVEENGPCSPGSTIIVNFYEFPSSYAGLDEEICIADGTYPITGSTSANGTILWSSSGDGTFSDPAIDNPVYTIGSETGTVTLTKTVSSPGSCADAVDFMILTLTPVPDSYAGLDDEICISDGTYPIAGATSANGTILWTTSGDGTFNDSALDNPVYNVGSETGTVTLTKTVSSAGSCADAVDFMILALSAEPVADAGVGGEECDLDFQLRAFPSAGTGTWTMSSGSGSASFVPNENDPLALVAVTEYGTKEFTWTEENGSCSDAEIISVSFYEAPTANPGTGGEVCIPEYQLGALPSTGSGIWSMSSGPGIADFIDASSNPSTRVSVDIYGTYIFTWTETNGPCTDAEDITVTFYEAPVSDAGADDQICGLEYILQAQPSAGTGLWTLTSGPGTAGFLPDANAPNATASVSEAGSYIFTWEESNGPCLDASIVEIHFFETPIVSASPPIDVCGLSADINVTSNIGSGIWTKISGPGDVNFSPADIIALNTVTVTEYGTYEFNWTATNGPCSQIATQEVNFYETPKSNAGSDSEVCGLTYQLAAQKSIGTGYWEVVGDDSGISFSPSNTEPDASVSVPFIGSYQFKWEETNGICSDFSIVTIDFLSEPEVYAGPDQVLDFIFSTNLEADYPVYGQGEWSVISGGGTVIDILDPLSEVNNLSLGENEFMWTIKTGVCEDVNDRVIITVNDLETPTVITPNNDGLNDKLIFNGIDQLSFSELLIYNRWGGEIYRSKDYKNDWEGKDQKDRDLIPDTYYYILKLSTGRIIKGFVEIRR